MQFALKLAISVVVIVAATQIGRRVPSLSGLIATMPLTGAIVLVWLWTDKPGDYGVMSGYAKGAFWGVWPSLLFFAGAYVAFRRGLPLSAVLGVSFGLWLAGAFVHQLFLRAS
ncbi:MAG: DUF3147 family protein [Phycisphaerae bacterium]|nr:DUF3147 family protein [Phycisphaerae bacterium]